MNNEQYSDKLITVYEDSILIRNYYFPFGSKRIYFSDIENMTVHKPDLFSGKYRYCGTGDFRTWFPPDNRTKRDKIFIMKIKNKWWRPGFTIEDPKTVLNLLKDKCPIIDKSI